MVLVSVSATNTMSSQSLIRETYIILKDSVKHFLLTIYSI